ncbi:MAG: hypothetical protein AAFO94_22920, partial [Bacteroidota bacterium]
MVKKIVLLFLLCTPLLLTAQQMWRSVAEPTQVTYRNAEKPTQYKTYQFDTERILQHLAKAPQHTDQRSVEGIRLSLPLPDGTAQDFELYEAPVMMPGLSAKYPEIRSYKGVSENSDVRISATPQGLHLIYNTPNGRAYVIPYAKENNDYALGYYKRHAPQVDEGFVCGVDGEFVERQS